MQRTAVFALLLCAAAAFGADSFVVSRIEIDGLRRTRRWVVERELGFAVGDTIGPKDLRQARNRLENLSIFNSVTVTSNRAGAVKVVVPELWPLWPVLGLAISEGKATDALTNPRDFFKHATLTAGGTYINSFGTAAKTYAVFNIGATQGVDLQYGTRWLSPSFPYAVNLGFLNVRETTNRVSHTDSLRFLQNVQISADVSTHQGAPSRVGLRLRYWGVHVETGQPSGAFLPDLKRYRTFWFNPYVILDRRDLEWYPSRGAYSETHLQLVTGNSKFVLSSSDLRGYFAFSEAERPPTLALRVVAGTSTQSTPRWAHFFYPFRMNLRGYSGLPGEAANFMVGSAELRYPLGPETTYTVPYIGHYGKNWPWGVSALLFGQIGELSLAGHRVQRNSVGGGFYFRVPYVEILNTSATVRDDGKLEFAMSTGVSF
jgi:outer membrane protein assembly factor BamA